MDVSKNIYFKRQTTLKEIGEQGQDLLQRAKVLVIGCGGLGSPIAIYLATSGIGHIHLVDFDKVSLSNLHRQVFYKLSDVNQPKVEILAEEIRNKAPYTKVTFTNKAVDKESILELLRQYHVVVDGTDNLPVKYLINDACVLLKKPLVYGSLYKFDGYVATFNVLDASGRYSCNLRDAFPKIATDIPNCEEAGTMNPIVGIIALLQVNEVIKVITRTGKLLTDTLLVYNSLQNSQLRIGLKKNETLNIPDLFENTDYMNVRCISQNPDLLIKSTELKEKLTSSALRVISILENQSAELPFKVHHKIPYKTFNVDRFKPKEDNDYVIICSKGITSYDVTEQINRKYPSIRVHSLTGGIEDFK